MLCGKLLFSENILNPQKYKKISYTLYIYNVILKYTSIYYTVNYINKWFYLLRPPSYPKSIRWKGVKGLTMTSYRFSSIMLPKQHKLFWEIKLWQQKVSEVKINWKQVKLPGTNNGSLKTRTRKQMIDSRKKSILNSKSSPGTDIESRIEIYSRNRNRV